MESDWTDFFYVILDDNFDEFERASYLTCCLLHHVYHPVVIGMENPTDLIILKQGPFFGRHETYYGVEVHLFFLILLLTPYTTMACAAGVGTGTDDRNSSRYRYIGNRRTDTPASQVVRRTADRDSSRYRYSGNRRTRQLALDCEGNWVESTHDVYENTWKGGELKLCVLPHPPEDNKNK